MIYFDSDMSKNTNTVVYLPIQVHDYNSSRFVVEKKMCTPLGPTI
jgi:hypothetical protein